MIPFYLINGFLGSGKTTLLKRILAEHADDKKVGVIQNEFAAVNIDAAELRREGKNFHILEVNRGSVFCVCLLSDFTTSLSNFIEEHQPDVLILEASGLSDPIAILQLLSASQLRDKIYLSSIWTIVDASTFLQMEKSTAVTHQVRIADRILINKTDLCEGELLTTVKGRISQLNPLAEISISSFCDIPIDFFARKNEPLVLQNADEFSKMEPHTRPPIGTAVIKSTKKISRDALQLFLKEQPSKAWRLKGHVQLNDGNAVMVQSVQGNTEMVSLENYVGPTELVAIGPDVDAKEFSKRFREYCE